jgi:uncharacterized protein (TIGR03086 family)
MLDLEPAAQEVIRLLDGVGDDQLTHPTPCEDTSVAAMLDHLMGLSLAFTWAARKETPPGGSSAPRAAAENLDPGWRDILPHRLADLVEAWRDPRAWEGMAQAGGVTMPAPVTGAVALDEVVLHGWDLARGTGQPYHCDEATAAAVLEFTTASAQPQNAAGRDGLFGPVHAVAQDAPAFDRALGFAGRNPDWAPARL